MTATATATATALVPQPERAARAGATIALTAYVLLLTLVPSRLVVGPLGAAGTPAQVLAMLALLWCAAESLNRSGERPRVPSLLRSALFLFAAAVVASYFAAATRPIDAVELSSADRGLLTLCAWLGIVLLTTGGLRTHGDLLVLLRRTVASVGWVAGLGILQFATGRAWIDRLTVPGLTLNSALPGVQDRVGFTRPAGTAMHPIEFGVILTLVLPLALHLAFHDVARAAWRRWTPPAAIALAVPLCISRSAILAAFVGLLVLLPTWDPRRRHQVYAFLAVLAGFVYVAVPGLLGAIRGLFLGIQADDSALSRTDSYGMVTDFFLRNPVLGRGVGTFLPSYRILDNQYLGTLIETGAVGLAALLFLLGAGIGTARAARRRAVDPVHRSLGQSLAASTAAGASSLATFDGLSFPMTAGILFLVIGFAAALYRIVAEGGPVGGADAAESSTPRAVTPTRSQPAPAS